MGGIKYYQLSKGEEMPDEFCAIRDIGGEPSEYVFYVPESDVAKLRELVRDMFGGYKGAVEMLPSSYSKNVAERAVMDISDRMRELGIEVGEAGGD